MNIPVKLGSSSLLVKIYYFVLIIKIGMCSSDEYVVIEDVETGINIGKKMIEKLGFEKYKCPKTEEIKFMYY